jgi:hypothetical protein
VAADETNARVLGGKKVWAARRKSSTEIRLDKGGLRVTGGCELAGGGGGGGGRGEESRPRC